MENILLPIYMSVFFILVFVYLFCKISELIDRRKARKKTPVAREPEKVSKSVVDVVGKSTTVFLAPLIPARIEPLMSEKLELELRSSAETEPDILSEEVEANLNAQYIPDEDELIQYANDDIDLTGEASQGLTYQQISHAIDVVHGKKSGETEEIIAGETLCVMPDDFLSMICMQTEYESMVKKLITCYVDSVGKIKPTPLAITDFDINKYV